MRPTEDWIESLVPDNLSNLDRQLFGDIHLLLQSDLLVKMEHGHHGRFDRRTLAAIGSPHHRIHGHSAGWLPRGPWAGQNRCSVTPTRVCSPPR